MTTAPIETFVLPLDSSHGHLWHLSSAECALAPHKLSKSKYGNDANYVAYDAGHHCQLVIANSLSESLPSCILHLQQSYE